MTRIDIDTVSDDGFDVVDVGRTDAVSDLDSSDHARAVSRDQAGPQQAQNPPASRQSAVVQDAQHGLLPARAQNDASVHHLAQALSGIPLEDSYGSYYPSSHDSTGELKRDKSIYDRVKSYIPWSNKDVVIAVMGMTGSGKTTFISKVTGRSDLKIGHDLTSCTRDIEVIETKIGDTTVRFVDTPGFSDTHLSDTEVLQMIADYLATAYKNDMKLSGIIYLHPISDTRITHHATKNLEMFRKLTGEKNLKNVVLTTSMWDKVSPEEGARREAELKSKFWKVFVALGANVTRYNGSPESARDVAAMLMGNHPFYLQLQEEMGKGNKLLRDTSAGRELMVEIGRMKKEHQREIEDLKATMLQASAEENKHVVEALKEHYQGKLAELQSTLRDERRMNESTINSLSERIQALESRSACSVM
ncbi:hypothetical protein S7711_02161 [Stachybotrys chartarum IBT 7711]|uniref:G domain-containing protein n=1 Tax=Stachybotrys chartarum (strain CBS 109288 / IBT 7711) TaxID=1280523 RepID=A0A084ARM4_STACB|nr:hypothetical protein S7711_02161 [Stachybotrys chartarum IBT 7711]